MKELYDRIIIETIIFFADSGDLVSAAYICLVFYHRFVKAKEENYI